MVQKRGLSKSTKSKNSDDSKNASDSKSASFNAEKRLASSAKKFKILQVLKQAQISLKQVKIPTAAERKKFTRAKILLGLKGLGVATQSEVDALQAKIKKIESALRE